MGILVLLVSHGGCDFARSDRVRGDLVLAQLKGQCLDQSADGMLGGVVGARSNAWLVLLHAGDGNQPAVVAHLDHVLRRLPDADEGAVQVGGGPT